jgi:hypothetical protein
MTHETEVRSGLFVRFQKKKTRFFTRLAQQTR